MYVYPVVGNVGPVPFTTILLVLVVQSKHLIPLSSVYVAPVKVWLYEPLCKLNTVVPEPGKLDASFASYLIINPSFRVDDFLIKEIGNTIIM
jgi:hypothetical protein